MKPSSVNTATKNKSSKPLKLGDGVETELVLTPFRACWLWNAAGIDLSKLRPKLSSIRVCISAKTE